ncbi:hypothetical protein [Helicobacter pylori]|uniref:hypothetical protein n=1 Tax=Helicobacter pylori TaxID=210 RepID=UPI0039802FAB
MDKILGEYCEIIEEEMRNQIEDAKKGISEKVESLKVRLNDPVVCYECMREGLIKTLVRAYGTYLITSIITSIITSKQGSHNE